MTLGRPKVEPPKTSPTRRDRRPARVGSLAVVSFSIVALTAVIVGIFVTRLDGNFGLIDSPLVGREAPDVVLPYMESDGDLVLSDLEGDIVVVNFWASWCLPCRSEHPALVAAARDLSGLGVSFVGVLYQDAPSQGVAFLEELGRAEPYHYVWDGDSRAALEFGVFGLPETFFVDREGTIVGKVSGAISYELLTSTVTTIALGRTVGEITTGDVQNRP